MKRSVSGSGCTALVAVQSSSLRQIAAAVILGLSLFLLPTMARAQQGGGVGATLTPFVGYVFTGNWYDGPVGTSIKNANAPLAGVQASVPFMKGLSLTGSLGYSSGDLRIGLPVLGGVNVGSAKTWMYDAAVELGGLAGRGTGVAPILTAGVGGMTNDIKASVLNVRSTNVAYTVGAGVDIGFTNGMAIRIQGKDWIGKFDSKEAVGFVAEGNTAHNLALTAGLRFSF